MNLNKKRQKQMNKKLIINNKKYNKKVKEAIISRIQIYILKITTMKCKKNQLKNSNKENLHNQTNK